MFLKLDERNLYHGLPRSVLLQIIMPSLILVILLHCQVLEVQLPGKKVVSAGAFWNGLRGQKLKKL